MDSLAELRAALLQNFVCLAEISLQWTQANTLQNILRLYGDSVEMAREKASAIGQGEMRLIVVEDPAPQYRLIRTTSGLVEMANVQAIRNKRDARNICAGEYSVHGSGTPAKFRRDLSLLIDRPWVERILDPARSLTTVDLGVRDSSGTQGWKTFAEFTKTLNFAEEHVFLRAPQVSADGASVMSGDLDLLVRNRHLFGPTCNASRGASRDELPGQHVQIAGNWVHLDVSEPGDGSLDERWQDNILQTRELNGPLFRPRPDHLLFSLLFHLTASGKEASPRHKEQIELAIKRLELETSSAALKPGAQEAEEWLVGFMTAHGFRVPSLRGRQHHAVRKAKRRLKKALHERVPQGPVASPHQSRVRKLRSHLRTVLPTPFTRSVDFCLYLLRSLRHAKSELALANARGNFQPMRSRIALTGRLHTRWLGVTHPRTLVVGHGHVPKDSVYIQQWDGQRYAKIPLSESAHYKYVRSQLDHNETEAEEYLSI